LEDSLRSPWPLKALVVSSLVSRAEPTLSFGPSISQASRSNSGEGGGQRLSSQWLSGQWLSGKFLSGQRLSGKLLGGKFLSGKLLGGKLLGGQRLSGKLLGGQGLSGQRLSCQRLSSQWLSSQRLSGQGLSSQGQSCQRLSSQGLCGQGLSCQGLRCNCMGSQRICDNGVSDLLLTSCKDVANIFSLPESSESARTSILSPNRILISDICISSSIGCSCSRNRRKRGDRVNTYTGSRGTVVWGSSESEWISENIGIGEGLLDGS